MRAFVVLGLVFLPYQAKRLACGNVSVYGGLFCVEWDVKPQLNQPIQLSAVLRLVLLLLLLGARRRRSIVILTNHG